MRHGDLHEEVEEIKAFAVDALALRVDIVNGKECDKPVDRTVGQFGRIDMFVHKDQIDLNPARTFSMTKPVAQHMLKRGGPGKNILIGSIASKMGVTGGSVHSAWKWGVLDSAKRLTLELGPLLINVNAVCPGFINTNLRDNPISEQAKAKNMPPAEFRKSWFDETAKSQVPLGYPGPLKTSPMSSCYSCRSSQST